MKLYLKNIEIKHRAEIVNADIYIDTTFKRFFIDADIANGNSLMWREEKVWTQVHKIGNDWYTMSPWTLALAEGRLQEYLDGLKE